MHSLNTEQIQQIIPHRHPFLLIDQIEDYVPGEYAVGYKGVSYHEDFFRGISTESSDAGCADFRGTGTDRCSCDSKSAGKSWKDCIFGGVQKCRFKGMVLPGDRLRPKRGSSKRKGPVGVGEATASVDGKTVVTAELTFMVGE